MRENFKLRKMKVGLVSVAITMLYIMTYGEAEASETSDAIGNHNVNKTEESETTSQIVQNNKEINADQTKKNTVKLDPIKPGDQKVTGTTLPNQLILLSIDKKDVSSFDSGNSELVMSKEDGKFEYDLNGRKIVHNQEIEVTSSSTEGLFDDEEDEELEEATTEKAGDEEESTEAKATYTTPRYENAYKVPEKQLDKKNGHHQVFIEPITEGSGIIKGHTSVKGKVALSINNKFINFEESVKGGVSKEGTKVIKGKTKFANAVVKVYSELGEAQLFPDLQVNEKGEFSFDSHGAGFRLQNGEKLNFAVVDPITGDPLSKLVTKEIDIEETPEEKADREFDERMENTPAYYKLYGDKIVGFDTNDFPITWFYPLGEKKVERTTPKLEK